MNSRRNILILAGIGVIPFLLIAMVIGARILPGLADIWDTPGHTPTEAELLGNYQILKKDHTSFENERIYISEQSGFKLEPNHKLEVFDLLALDFAGNPRACNYNGTGEWGLRGDELEMILYAASPPKAGNTRSCDPERFGRFRIRGHSAPFRLSQIIGDPDEGRSLTYLRQ
jgi:hypothetical protein